MAIREYVCIRRHLWGDGESKTVAIDVSDAKPDATPEDVKCFSAGHPEFGVIEAKLAGSVLNIEFENAPPDASFEVTAELLYSGAAKPKHEKAEAKEHATHHKAK